MANSAIAGTASLKVDGVTYNVRGEFSYDPSLIVRETKVGQDRVHGYSEMPKAPWVSATLSDMGGLSVLDFNNMTDVSIVVELANGKTLSGADFWTVGEHEVNTAEGTFPCRWEGRKLLELV